MKDIEELIKSSERYKNAVIQKRLKSEKNTVSYVILNDKPRVLKWYPPGLKRNMETEYSVLKKGLSKINIPTVFEKDVDNNVLVTGYIIGNNLCDVINDENTSFDDKEKSVERLAEWFISFHDFFKTKDSFLIRGDSTLRNFILTDRIWGVDFEESREGKPVEDIACMCSSILTTDPMFTKEKFQLCTTFITSYEEKVKWGLGNVDDEIAYAILERIQWRPEEESILRSFSQRIRKRGIRHNF
jgi:tRNA A-37 threonylcarbamoyl transferase component Bud32